MRPSTLLDLLISKDKEELLSTVFIAAATVAMISSVSVVSAQQPGSKSGTIASLQNGKDGKPAWILTGAWVFRNINSSSPTFNATFNMVMLNGSAPHKHTITDFKMTGSPTVKGTSTTYNGTATVSLKKGQIASLPVSIKLMGQRTMSLWIDPTKNENHFGNTPIYGTQHKGK